MFKLWKMNFENCVHLWIFQILKITRTKGRAKKKYAKASTNYQNRDLKKKYQNRKSKWKPRSTLKLVGPNTITAWANNRYRGFHGRTATKFQHFILAPLANPCPIVQLAGNGQNQLTRPILLLVVMIYMFSCTNCGQEAWAVHVIIKPRMQR
jgi:hypothetical protein